MLNNPGTEGMHTNPRPTEGTPVFDAVGEKIGTLSSYNAQGGYIVVQKGWLFPHDLYIPQNAIRGQEADGIHLNMHKNDVKQQNWSMPPTNAAPARGSDSDLAETPPLRQDAESARPETASPVPPGTLAGAMGGYGGAGAFAPAEGMGATTPPPVHDEPLGGTTSSTPAAGRDAASNVGSGRETASSVDSGTSAHPTPVQGDDVRIPLREEEMVVGKQEQEKGRVHLHKDVIEERQTASAPVTHEEVFIERVPGQEGGDVNLTSEAFSEQDIEIPIMGEDLVAGKRTNVNEEIHLHKRAFTEEQQVSDTLRKERLNVEGIEQEGELPLQGTNEPEQEGYTSRP